MRAMRLFFIGLVLAVELGASIVVTLSSEQILQALQTPETLTGLISGSISVVVMVLLMGGLFLPRFDRTRRYLRQVEAARTIVERAQANEALDPQELAAYRNLLYGNKWRAEGNRHTAPIRRSATVRRPPATPQDDWPYGR